MQDVEGVAARDAGVEGLELSGREGCALGGLVAQVVAAPLGWLGEVINVGRSCTGLK